MFVLPHPSPFPPADRLGAAAVFRSVYPHGAFSIDLQGRRTRHGDELSVVMVLAEVHSMAENLRTHCRYRREGGDQLEERFVQAIDSATQFIAQNEDLRRSVDGRFCRQCTCY